MRWCSPAIAGIRRWLHHDTCASLGLVRTTLHDSRHSFAVQKLRDGWPVTLVAHNLGHQDAYMVFERYGRFVPDMADRSGLGFLNR